MYVLRAQEKIRRTNTSWKLASFPLHFPIMYLLRVAHSSLGMSPATGFHAKPTATKVYFLSPYVILFKRQPSAYPYKVGNRTLPSGCAEHRLQHFGATWFLCNNTNDPKRKVYIILNEVIWEFQTIKGISYRGEAGGIFILAEFFLATSLACSELWLGCFHSQKCNMTMEQSSSAIT